MGQLCGAMDCFCRKKITMDIQLICTDIDGTLLNKDRRLSETTLETFHRLSPVSPIVLISSRMPKSMRLLQNELKIEKHPIIAYNGSLVLDQNTVLYSEGLSTAFQKTLVDAIKNTSIHLSFYHQDEWYVPENDYWAKREAHNTRIRPVVQSLEVTLDTWKKENKVAHKIMCMGEEDEIDVLYQHLQKQHADEVNAYRSKATYIEVSIKSQDKASAMELLLQKKYPHWSMENVIAFGDNYNDVTLLKKAGYGVAVANAKQEVIEGANAVCSANVDDGVALFLKELLIK